LNPHDFLKKTSKALLLSGQTHLRHCGLDPQSIDNEPPRYAIARRAFTNGKALNDVKKGTNIFLRFIHIFDSPPERLSWTKVKGQRQALCRISGCTSSTCEADNRALQADCS